MSSHKIHGPKGVGFLYINEKVRVQPQILGGGQQNGMRSGTDNVPGIAGLGVAAEMVYTDFDKKIQHLYALKERMAEGLSKLGDITVNGMPLMEGAPHIMSVTFHGVRSEVLLHTLEEFGVYISAGSACSSHKRKPSATLTAIGLSRADVESTVRGRLLPGSTGKNNSDAAQVCTSIENTEERDFYVSTCISDQICGNCP